MTDSHDDEIIELTQMVDADASEGNVIELTQIVEDQDQVLELEDAAGPAILPGTGESSDSQAQGGPGEEPDLSDITRDQLEAAIERVVERKFSQQIEKILFEVTEKVLKKEITDIKAGLQKDLDDIDNA